MEGILLLFVIAIVIIMKKSSDEIKSTKIFKVYKNPLGKIQFVKVGWSWPAAIFGFFWAFYKQMWQWGIIWLIVEIITIPFTAGMIIVFPIVIMGLYSNKKLEENLLSRGYELETEIEARNVELATAEYYKSNRDDIGGTVKEKINEEVNKIKNSSKVNNEKDCPMCAETIKAAAKICRYCGHKFDYE